ncbi:MAG: glycoside hydrolase family 65 protein [Nitrospinota bacterium]
MLKRTVSLPPEHIYPVEDWKMIETQFNEDFLAQAETIFATSNGYLGMRGNFDEGRPVFQQGTFINGFYESWPITYGEEAFGFAKTGQSMLNVPDAKIIRLYVDDEPFFLPTANLTEYERILDMKAGTLDRILTWETPSGKIISIKSRRVVSFRHRHLAAISYEIELKNAAAPVVISSEIINAPSKNFTDNDPRRARRLSDRVLVPKLSYTKDLRILLGYLTNNSKMSLACGIEHSFETACQYSVTTDCTHNSGETVFSINAQPNIPIRLVKFVSYHTSRSAPPGELCTRGERTLKRALNEDFEALLKEQREYLNRFWSRSDIQISGGHPRAQQLIRFNLFQIIQAAARAEGTGVGARGLTGQAYDGHYFWDTEMYVLPFLVHTSPRIAKNLLKFRYSHLEKARQRAKEVNQKGALFPWRTINGEEASAYFAAGTAQYHINADIMYALRKYVEVTGDKEFLFSVGAEMLVETSRLWLDLGCYPNGQKGDFHIHGVTGPDEYNAIVDNNMYTNLMARQNLFYAISTVEKLKKENPKAFKSLVHKTGLQENEVSEWKKAAERMYIPYDHENKINAQDDNFLSRESWDFKNTPPEKYPLLLHFHPLVIYRCRVIKQADVLLAMFLLGNEFSKDQKKRNFDYYDPLTTGDSSLSACVESIIAFEVGYTEKALEYLNYALLMDLANIGGNVQDGAHIACMGGTWLSFVYGMAGMRDYEGKLSFSPNLPKNNHKLDFPIMFHGQLLQVSMGEGAAVYRLREGSELVFHHKEEEVILKVGEEVSLPLE